MSKRHKSEAHEISYQYDEDTLQDYEQFEFPDREIVSDPVWTMLLDLTNSDSYCHCYSDEHANSRGGYEDDTIAIKPYWWGDEDSPEVAEPNFLYKPTGFELRWYKYPFRACYMNQNLHKEDVKALFEKIILHMLQQKYGSE